jgi:hypothetical protein
VVRAAQDVLVSTVPPGERLSDKQYVVLLLRLVVDSRGAIVYGDVGGPVADNTADERTRT